MGNTLELFRPLCNGYVRVESRTETLTHDAGFPFQRGSLVRTALIDRRATQMKDPQAPGSPAA